MRWLHLAVAFGLTGCVTAARPPISEPPLQDEGAVYVYLSPVPFEARGTSFTVKSVTAVGEGGLAIPLQVRLARIGGPVQLPGERMLAHGRLPRGQYGALEIAIADPTLTGEERGGKLVASETPSRVQASFEARSGQAAVLTLRLDPQRRAEEGAGFSPRFTASVPARTPAQLVGACSNTQTNDVTLFDDWTKVVTNVVGGGGGTRGTAIDAAISPSPHGLAIDPLVARAWVALAGQDQIEVVDLSRAESTSRIPMRGGDEPRAMQMLPDRRTLLVANFRSQTAAFVDAFSTQELARVPVGDAPWSITLQRGGNRAFVLNRRSNNFTVIDLGSRQAIATVPTEPEPLFAQVSRDGRRLYVIHAGSPFMNEYALPGLTVTRRIRVGLGASTIKLDSRTDLLYIGFAEVGRIEVFDSFSALPVDSFEVPGWVSNMAINDPQDQLFALMPSLRAVAVLDLTSRRLITVIDLSGDPYEIKLAAERN